MLGVRFLFSMSILNSLLPTRF